MFRSTRIKLTAWYLLIIMVVSVAFSVVIYRVSTLELERLSRLQRFRFERQIQEWPDFNTQSFPLIIDPELIKETERRLVFNLLFINAGIFVVSGGLGYFLSGKNLRPIKEMMEEQNLFVADASHELRTPLTALRTSMEVSLRDKKMPLDEARTLIKSNLEEVIGLQSLSDKLLSLAHFQRNDHNLNFEEIDIAETIEKTTKKIISLASEKEISLEKKVESQTVWADEENLQEMLFIFLDNSIKYTPRGGRVTIEARPDKRWLVIQIKDTGIGIAKKDLPHIFDRFYRADQSRSKKKIGGFGLGLSLAKTIVEMHKGSVEVSSVLGKKTIFTIKLPLKHG